MTEFKMIIEDTDFGIDLKILADGESEFEPQDLKQSMRQKVFNEIKYLQTQAVYPLNMFLEKMLHGY